MFELTKDIEYLNDIARRGRINLLKALNRAKSGHTGGSLSSVDILTVLYFSVMRHDPDNPRWEDRDRFIMSKGHGAPALYSILSLAGYIPEKELMNLRQPGSMLQGHPEYDLSIGIEATTGSLGHGLSASNGIALAGRLDKKDYRVYTLLSDGELQEGSTWEAITTSSYRKLDNLCAIVDRNRFQNDGAMEEIKDINPVPDKFEAFGWQVEELEDGHDIQALINAFQNAESNKGKPYVIIANTIKGKGVSIFENKGNYHGVAPSDDELEISRRELGDIE